MGWSSVYLTAAVFATVSFSATVASFKASQHSERGKCERITVPFCSDVLYNFTRLPNKFGHMTQEKVAMEIGNFGTLIEASCSKNLRFFICSIYIPMCSEAVDMSVTSCQSVCQEVKQNCEKMLKTFGLSWPPILDCQTFPKFPDQLCMNPNSNTVPDSIALEGVGNPEKGTDSVAPRGPGNRDREQGELIPASNCLKHFIDLDPSDPTVPCAPVCGHDHLFGREHKTFAQHWMSIWASLCLAVTAFTVLTCCLDTSRFKFPERPIIYLAACYHLYSWGYVLRLILGWEEVACQKVKNGQSYLISGGLDNPKCVILFITLYYFSMASSIWWVFLTFTWYLAAGKKWVHEAIEAWSSYFHLVAWGIPALLSIAVLITHRVDSSELTGLCFVGNSDPMALVGFVVAPLGLFLLLGCTFIVAGFVAMCSVRKTLQTQGTNIAKLEKLMVKIGIFSVLYVIPAICVIACYSYHALVLLDWRHMKTACKQSSLAGTAAPHQCKVSAKRPQVEIYMLKIFMSLIVGITSGMWVSSRKTCDTWANFIFCGHLRGPQEKTGPLATPLCQNVGFEARPQTFSLSQPRYPGSYKTDSSGSRKYIPHPHIGSARFYPSASSEATKV